MDALKDKYIDAKNGFTDTDLDHWLEQGYIRSGIRMVFRVQTFKQMYGRSRMYSFCYPIRFLVQQQKDSRSAMSVLSKCAQLTVEFKPLGITVEFESLYQAQAKAMKDTGTDGCGGELFYGANQEENPFTSFLFEVRDNGKLVGVAIVDHGWHSMAISLVIADPTYRKMGIRELLLLKALDWARDNKMTYLYAGPVEVTDKRFDYKLGLSSKGMQFFHANEVEWKDVRKSTAKDMESYFFKAYLGFDPNELDLGESPTAEDGIV